MNAPSGSKESGDPASPTLNQHLVQAANKAMQQNQNSTNQQSIVITGYGTQYEELKYHKELSEEVVIPDDLPVVSEA